MLIEFQMNPTSFFTLFRNRLRHVHICNPLPFAFTLGTCNGPTLIDRIIIQNDTLVKNNFDGTLSIHQGVTIRMVSVAALESANLNPAPACFEPMLTAIFVMSIALDAAGAKLCLEFDRFDLVSDPILGAMEALIKQQFSQPCHAFDLGPLQELLNEPITVVNGGLSLAGDSQRIAIRLAIADDAPPSSWATFHNGNPFAAINFDWTLLLPHSLISRSINTRLRDSLQTASDMGKFKLNAGPTTSYSMLYGAPRFTSKLSGEAVDACICFWEEIDLDVDITTTAFLGVPESNILQTDLHMTWDLNDAEVFCCSLTAGLFWLHVGAFMLQEGKLDAGFYPLGFLAGPLIVTIIGSALVGGQVADEIALPAQWEEIGEDKKRFRLRQNVNLGGDDFGGLTLNSILAQAQGPQLGGAIGTINELESPVLTVVIEEFAWVVEDKCVSKDEMRVIAQGRVGCGRKPYNKIALEVCALEILSGSDPLQQFTPYFQRDGAAADIVIPFTSLKPQYLAAPYPCKVRIVSSAGVRIVTIPALPVITQREVNGLIQTAFLGQPTNCEEAARSGHPFWKGSRYNPKWGIDPPPELERYFQLWDVVITGLAPGEQVRIANATGRLMGQARATLRGVAHLNAFLPAQRTQNLGVTLQRSTSPLPLLTPTAKREIFLRQTLLTDAGRLRLLAEITGFAFGRMGEEIGVLTEQGFHLFNLQTPGYAQLTQQQPMAGMRDLVAFAGGFITWGSEGMRAFATDIKLPRLDDIRDITTHGQFLMVLAGDSVRRFDAEGQPVGSIPIPGARQLAISRSVMAVSAPNEKLLHLVDPLTLSSLAVHRMEVGGPLRPAKLASAGAAFAIGSQTIGITGRTTLIEGVSNEQHPWFAGVKRAGHLLARVNDSKRSLQLYRAVGSRQFKR